MKKNLQDIDKLFKAALDDHEETPDAAVWDTLDKHLDKTSVVDLNRKYFRLKKIAIGLLILLIGAGAYTLNILLKPKAPAKETVSKKYEAPKNSPTNLTFHKSEPIANTLKENKENLQANNVEDSKQLQKNSPKNITKEKNNTVQTNEFLNDKKINKKNLENAAEIASIEAETKQAAESKNTVDVGFNLKSKGKTILHKRRATATITNADYEEVIDTVASVVASEKNNELKENFTGLTRLNTATAFTTNVYQKKILTNTNLNILPLNNITNSVPIKPIGFKKKGRFSATVYYASNISKVHLENENHERRPGPIRPDDNRDKDKISHEEQHQPSTTFGTLVDYKLNKHWSLQSGISLTNKVINIDPKTIYAHTDNNGAVKFLYDCSSGYLFLSAKSATNPILGDSLFALKSNTTLQYAAIPFTIKYNFQVKKFDFFTGLGTSVNLLTKGKLETAITNGTTKEQSVSNKINGLKTSYFEGNISLGASYNISQSIALSFMPSYNFALTSSTKDAAVKSYPNSMSLAAGLRYKF